MKIFKGLYGTLEKVIGVLALLGVACFFLPRLFHISPYVVLSGSMEPEILTGSLVYIKEGTEELQKGDVIGYRMDKDTRIIHRIVSINWEDQEVITKGDANQTEDLYPIPLKKIEGKAVAAIPYIGYGIAWVQSNAGMVAIGAIVVFFLIGGILQGIWEEERKLKKV